MTRENGSDRRKIRRRAAAVAGLLGLLAFALLSVSVYRAGRDPGAWLGSPLSEVVLPAPPLVALAEERVREAQAALADEALPVERRFARFEERLREAERALVAALRRQPASAEALSLLAAVRFELDPLLEGEEAERQLDLVRLAARSAPDVPLVQRTLGELLLEMGHRSEAEERFRAALELEPAAVDEVVAVLRAHFATADEIAAALPRHADVLAGLRAPFEEEGREAEYAALVERLLDAAGHEPSASLLRSLGRTLLALDEPARLATRMIGLGAQADPEIDAERLRQLAAARLAQGETSTAIASAQEAASRQPDSPVYVEFLGETYAATGRHDDAVAAYRRALRIVAVGSADPATRARLYGKIGAVEEERADLSAALDAYRLALEVDPEEPWARRRMERLRGR